MGIISRAPIVATLLNRGNNYCCLLNHTTFQNVRVVVSFNSEESTLRQVITSSLCTK